MRGRYEIIKDILSTIGGPSKKTEIVYQANLGFHQADKYLNLLVEDDLLEPKMGYTGKKYQITEKGKEVLGLLKKVEDNINLP